LAVSGMMIPPLVVLSSSIRETSTRSCKGRNFISICSFLFSIFKTFSGSLGFKFSTQALQLPTQGGDRGARASSQGLEEDFWS